MKFKISYLLILIDIYNLIMSVQTDKMIRQLEADLSEFLIDETTPPNPAHRNESETYKYKGLMLLSIDPRVKRFENTFLVRIGTLEAEFTLSAGEKVQGSVGPLEDKLIFKWFNIGDNSKILQTAYRRLMQEMLEEKEDIRPFGLDMDDDDDV